VLVTELAQEEFLTLHHSPVKCVHQRVEIIDFGSDVMNCLRGDSASIDVTCADENLDHVSCVTACLPPSLANFRNHEHPLEIISFFGVKP
jgi:hypothetical protein